MADDKKVVGAEPRGATMDVSAVTADDTHVHLPTEDLEHYRRTVPLWKRVWQHSLTQMMLLSVQAFCGPAMSDAIAGKYPELDAKYMKSEDITNFESLQVLVVAVLRRLESTTSPMPSTTPF